MKITITKNKLKKFETSKVMRIIYTSFFTYNHKDASNELCEKIEKRYGQKAKKIGARKRFLRSEILLIAKKEKKIVGIIRGRSNFIKNLYIKPNILGYGIGTKLIKKFEKIAKFHNSREILVKPALFAKDFYKKQGYKEKNDIFFYKNI